MIGRLVGRGAAVAGRTALGGLVGGPLGAVAAGAGPAVYRGGKAMAGKKGTLKAATMGMQTNALRNSAFLRTHPRLANTTGFMSRHPVATAAGIYTAGSAYHQLPGAQKSRRNQSDRYLRRVRQHQQSTALARLVGSSTGAYA